MLLERRGTLYCPLFALEGRCQDNRRKRMVGVVGHERCQNQRGGKIKVARMVAKKVAKPVLLPQSKVIPCLSPSASD